MATTISTLQVIVGQFMLQHVGSPAMRTLLLHLLFTSSTVKAELSGRYIAHDCITARFCISIPINNTFRRSTVPRAVQQQRSESTALPRPTCGRMVRVA